MKPYKHPALQQRLEQQFAATVTTLMAKAISRATQGKVPTREEANRRARLTQCPETGRIVLDWDGSPVLVIQCNREGFGWEFMNAAALPEPPVRLTMVGG